MKTTECGWIPSGWIPRGMPTINVSMTYRDNERRMSEQMMADAVEMLKAADVEDVAGFNRETIPGSVIHEMGTARMGRQRRGKPLISLLDA